MISYMAAASAESDLQKNGFGRKRKNFFIRAASLTVLIAGYWFLSPVAGATDFSSALNLPSGPKYT
ncbi:MAG: hypothetical protein KGM95_08130, partial [Betaproteobacteria bacterium]|nr:hypothetical protein [Betaproteobacteria bacterium]